MAVERVSEWLIQDLDVEGMPHLKFEEDHFEEEWLLEDERTEPAVDLMEKNEKGLKSGPAMHGCIYSWKVILDLNVSESEKKWSWEMSLWIY